MLFILLFFSFLRPNKKKTFYITDYWTDPFVDYYHNRWKIGLILCNRNYKAHQLQKRKHYFLHKKYIKLFGLKHNEITMRTSLRYCSSSVITASGYITVQKKVFFSLSTTMFLVYNKMIMEIVLKYVFF